MKSFSRTAAVLALAAIAGLAMGCQTSEDDGPDDLELALAAFVAAPGAWFAITPTAGSITIPINGSTDKTFNYSPSCSGRPGSSTDYRFFVKLGTSNNLLINFMGGGACWDGRNCLGVDATQTFIDELGQVNLIPLALASSVIDAGILSHTNSSNPFKDYTMIFVPYCTGDIFWGSKDTVYTDPVQNSPSTIHHRGFDNFLAVLNYLKTDFPSSNVGRVFVTGQSAGGYGAIFTYPYIKETYFTNQVDVLGDAAAGAIPGSNEFEAAIRVNWGTEAVIPNWISGLNVTGTALDALTLGDFYRLIASHGNYATSRFAHYTSEYDGNQRFFYNVQNEINVNNKTYVADSTMFGSSNGFQVSDSLSCEWRTRMQAIHTTAAMTTNSNFRSYNAPGDVHTISMSNDFYSTTSNGTTLLSFYENMLTGTGAAWQSVQCTSCNAPATSTSSSGLVCP